MLLALNPVSPASALVSVDDSTAHPSTEFAALTPTGRLILSAETSGAWNLFAADVNASPAQRLAANANPARDPAVSPDGRAIAFRSHRDGLWEIYAMPAGGGVATRLTRGMVYSGAPTWSPDGKRIAFESYAHGDLDIWVMNAEGSQFVDLTDDSRAQDYAPAWSPDGKWIAFTSWRTSTQQIFIVPADCITNCKATNVSQSKSDDQKPAWSPDSKKLAFVSDRDGQRAIYTADFTPTELKNATRVTFSGWDDSPAWSPDGKWIAFVSVRPTRQPVYIISADGGVPHILDDSPDYAASVAWAPNSVPLASATDISPSPVNSPLYQVNPDLAPAGSGHVYDQRRMTSTRLDPGINRLNGAVADSFIALQNRLKQEVGYDFLGVLSEMNRPLDLQCDITCDTLSWHKAGRAFDTRLDYTDARGAALEIVLEDQQGETYWRMYLRASAQDGSMGEPMKEAPWDLGYRARWVVGRGDGGIKKPVPSGFYVDYTELAREYGWERISSHEDDNFDWRTNKIAAEYWHYERRDGLTWYLAMRQIYAETDLSTLAEWNALARAGYDGFTLYVKGLPAPSKSWRWYALGP